MSVEATGQEGHASLGQFVAAKLSDFSEFKSIRVLQWAWVYWSM